MAKKIKVDLIGSGHSSGMPAGSVGRGVGYYTQFLAKALSKIGSVELTSKDPDVIHYPFFDLFYPTLPLIKRSPTIVTIHDLTPLILSHLYPKGIKGSLNLILQRLSLQSAKAIITDSHNSKEDIVDLFHFPKNKIFPIALAVDPMYAESVSAKNMDRIKKKYNLPEKFVLAVSAGPNPNKNLPRLAEVTKELNIPFVIVGKGMTQTLHRPVHPELKDLVRLHEYDHILYPGFVPSKDLSGFYRLATLYCLPSLYEGFGLPLLEAMTAGCPVVSSNSSSLPEIFYPGAITFDPASRRDMKKAISKALSLNNKDKQSHIKKGLARSKDFSWEKTAQATLEVYRSVL